MGVKGLNCLVEDSGLLQVSGFRVQSSRTKVQGLGYRARGKVPRVWGLGFGVQGFGVKGFRV